MQAVDERLQQAAAERVPDRICVRCGNRIPAAVLRENRDAIDCNGTCDGGQG